MYNNTTAVRSAERVYLLFVFLNFFLSPKKVLVKCSLKTIHFDQFKVKFHLKYVLPIKNVRTKNGTWIIYLY